MASPEHLTNQLAEVNEAIEAHPLSSSQVKAVFEVVERHGRDNKEAIATELREWGLPSLEEMGRIQAKTSFSWWKLHRRRRKLMRKLGQESS